MSFDLAGILVFMMSDIYSMKGWYYLSLSGWHIEANNIFWWPLILLLLMFLFLNLSETPMNLPMNWESLLVCVGGMDPACFQACRNRGDSIIATPFLVAPAGCSSFDMLW